MITALASVLMFFLYPPILGRGILRFFSKNSLAYPFVSYYITGMLSFYGATLLTYYGLSLLAPGVSFATVFPFLVAGAGLIALPLNFWKPHDFTVRRNIFPVLLSLALAGVVYTIWQFHSPYPFNWDLFEHQTLVNNILTGRLSFMSSQISDTFGFNSYSTIWHTTLAMSQVYFKNLSILTYWETIGFFHFFFVILVSYLLGKEITGNKQVAGISAILAAFIFDSNVSFTSLFFMPQTFTAVVFVFLFLQLIKNMKQNSPVTVPMVIMGALFLFLNHYVVGTLAAIIYIGVFLYYRYPALLKSQENKRKIIGVLFFVAFLAILFSSFVELGSLNHGEASAFTQTLLDKFTTMQQVYGFLLFIFLPLGIVTALRKRDEYELVTVFLMLGTLCVVLLQLPYVMKFYVLARFFVQLFIAIGIVTIMEYIPVKLVRCGAYSILLVSLGIIFISNIFIWKSVLVYQDTTTQVSASEIQAADFLKAHYAEKDALLISDPATQNILEPLSAVNSQGGAYMSSQTRTVLYKVSQTLDPQKEANLLSSISDQVAPTSGPRLVVLSGRYFVWQASSKEQKNSLSYNIWAPFDLTLSDIEKINKLLSQKKNFKYVYGNKALVILEVKK